MINKKKYLIIGVLIITTLLLVYIYWIIANKDDTIQMAKSQDTENQNDSNKIAIDDELSTQKNLISKVQIMDKVEEKEVVENKDNQVAEKIPNQELKVKEEKKNMPEVQEVVGIKVEEIVNPPVVEVSIEKPKEVIPQSKVETFKRNDRMIQNLKTAINNNLSQYMIDYGYDIIIDQSIIKSTNQFTYTQKRVIDMLAYKCGNIKIYAQDYYVDGEFVWTECYLI